MIIQTFRRKPFQRSKQLKIAPIGRARWKELDREIRGYKGDTKAVLFLVIAAPNEPAMTRIDGYATESRKRYQRIVYGPCGKLP